MLPEHIDQGSCAAGVAENLADVRPECLVWGRECPGLAGRLKRCRPTIAPGLPARTRNKLVVQHQDLPATFGAPLVPGEVSAPVEHHRGGGAERTGTGCPMYGAGTES